MPVIDHEIHSMTQFNDTKRYGCHNRGAYAGAYVANGKDMVPHRMSRECRYDRSLKDPWCADCKHRGSGEAYDAKVRELASVK